MVSEPEMSGIINDFELPGDGDLEGFFSHKINNFPLCQISIESPGLVSNQICFCISVKKNGPAQAQRPSVEILLS